MSSRITMIVSEHDTKNAEKNIFISFRKSLKKLGTDEYWRINTNPSSTRITKNILMSVRKQVTFDGCIQKYNKNLDNNTFPRLLAETVFTMFKILCSMSVEYDTRRHISEVAGVVNDVPRGTPAIWRIHSVINTLVMIWKEHSVFQLLDDSIYAIVGYSKKTFCMDEFDYVFDYDYDGSDSEVSF